jgi:MoaA/NifB/PqqE/SkfB family radical SAM enzyme
VGSVASVLTPFAKLGDYRLEQVIFFVTSICNLRCRHCFYWDNLNTMPNLAWDQIEAISRTAPPFRTMLASGGEPFLRKDLFQIFDLFHANNGTKWFSIPTSGFWPEKIERLVTEFLADHRSLHLRINVSIDGREATHDEIRGVKSSYRRAVETLDRLRGLRHRFPQLSVGVTSVLMRGNVEEVLALADELWLHHRPDTHNVVVVREGFEGKYDLRLRHEELGKLRRVNEEIHERYMPFEGRFDTPTVRGVFNQAKNRVMLRSHYDNISARKDWDFPCVAGRVIVVIDANGDLRACEMRPAVLSLKDYDFDFGRALRADPMQAEIAALARDRCFCSHGCFSLPSLERHARTMLIKVPVAMARIYAKVRRTPAADVRSN